MQTHNEVCKEQEFPKADGVTPLHSAASFGHLEACQVLFKGSDDKNPVDNRGRTPVICAVQKNHYLLSIYLVKCLIKNWIFERIGG